MAVEVNYTRDVQPFDDDPGTWTDDEIADSIGGQTYEQISVGDSRQFHLDSDWWLLADVGIYEGEFQTLRDDPSTPAGVKATLRRVWQIIFGVGQITMGTTLRRETNGNLAGQFSGELLQTLAWAVTNGSITQDEVDQFYLLGNQLKYKGEKPVASDVATSRQAWIDSNAGLAAVDRVNSKCDAANQAAGDSYDAGNTPAQIEADGDAAYDAWTP